jgi:hypothetical protein
VSLLLVASPGLMDDGNDESEAHVSILLWSCGKGWDLETLLVILSH